jgi:HSP20 family protein
MSDFLEKLKKGMGAEITPEIPKETPMIEEPKIELMSIAKAPESVKKNKTPKKIKVSNKKSSFTPGIFEQEGELVVDVFETEKNVIIQSPIAGINQNDLDILIEKDVVMIKGRRENCLEEKAENYFYQECYWGKFSKEIILPVEADGSKAEASMKNGVLTITIPKIIREEKTKLNIKSIE